jgi:hypothetical protein
MTVPPRPTRRQLVAGGIGAAAAGLVGISSAAAEQGTTGRGQAMPPPLQDGAILQQLLEAERVLEYGAEKSLASGKLGHDARELVLLILANEEEHVAKLQEELRALHIPDSSSKQTSSTFPRQQAENLFQNIKTEVQALQGMVQLENLVESAYFIAAGTFHTANLSLLAAEILAVEAQQWALLEALLHRGDPTKAAPHPAVRGAQTIGKPHTTTSS